MPFELRTTPGLQNCRRQRGARLPTAGSTSTWHTNHSFLGFGMVGRRGAYLCIPQPHQDPSRTLQMSTPDKNEARRCGEKLLVVVGATEQRAHRQNQLVFFFFLLVLFFFRKRERNRPHYPEDTTLRRTTGRCLVVHADLGSWRNGHGLSPAPRRRRRRR